MLQRKLVPIFVGISVMVFCSYLFAQAPTSPPPPRQDPRLEQAINGMFRDMDANHDGKISKQEWMDFYEKQFNLIDNNGDGYLTREKLREYMTERMRAAQRRPPA